MSSCSPLSASPLAAEAIVIRADSHELCKKKKIVRLLRASKTERSVDNVAKTPDSLQTSPAAQFLKKVMIR